MAALGKPLPSHSVYSTSLSSSRYHFQKCSDLQRRSQSLISQSFLFLIIGIEFYAYVVTRQIVNVFEWLVAWRSDKRQLRRDLRKAKTYEEWKRIAKQLDKYLGFDEWKESEDDGYFDYSLVSWTSLLFSWFSIFSRACPAPLVGPGANCLPLPTGSYVEPQFCTALMR